MIAATTFSTTLVAQTLSKQKLAAAYLYNFAKNIEWPNEANMASFTIGVYGSIDPLLLAELNQLPTKAQLKNHPIRIIPISSLNSLAPLQVLYIEQANAKIIEDLYNALAGKPILLVTMDYPSQQLVMVNLISTDNNRLRFEVNKSNLLNQGLKPLPELILNGGSEIDVAKLYREGQASLIDLQKQLLGREKTLRELTSAIQTQQSVNQRLEAQLTDLNKKIQASSVLIASQADQIKIQIEQIKTGKKERTELLHEMDLRTLDLKNQRQQLDQISIDIKQRENHLIDLNGTIQHQEVELQRQKNSIVDLDALVNAQRRSLNYLYALVVLGVLLIAAILIGYSIKRRDNLRLAEHTKDLQLAKDRLAIAKRKAEDASNAKSEFLSLMSHELRTPLQAIIGYTDVVIEELKLANEKTHIGDLTRVINNSERLLKLINGVLDLAKIESGRMGLDLTEVKLSSVVEEAVNTVKSLIEKNEIQLNIKVNDGAVLPIADHDKLLHIFINLLGNAVKFSPKGQVTLTALHEPTRIYLSVADTGIGLSAEQQEQIFEPFKQVDSSNTRKFQGSGLGLSITRQLCELMGGNISVQSELGKGACFIVELPLPIEYTPEFGALNVNEGANPSANDNQLITNQNQLVMIDDDPAFLDIMARTMRGEGYNVHTATDAETGFQLIQTIKPQIITLDLLLPDQHGWLLFEKIKADSELTHIPIIIISIVDERKNNKSRHAEDYLTKPIRRETLRLAVQKLVVKN